MTHINWDQIHQEAIGAMKNAYAPYSKFPVGSYVVGLCAECGLGSNLISTGGGRLIAVVCVDGQGNYLAPCGRCRQLLFEHGGPEALLMTDDGPQKMSAMLPWAFGPDDLDRNER